MYLKCTTGTVTLCRLSIIVQRKIQSPSPWPWQQSESCLWSTIIHDLLTQVSSFFSFHKINRIVIFYTPVKWKIAALVNRSIHKISSLWTCWLGDHRRKNVSLWLHYPWNKQTNGHNIKCLKYNYYQFITRAVSYLQSQKKLFSFLKAKWWLFNIIMSSYINSRFYRFWQTSILSLWHKCFPVTSLHQYMTSEP